MCCVFHHEWWWKVLLCSLFVLHQWTSLFTPIILFNTFSIFGPSHVSCALLKLCFYLMCYDLFNDDRSHFCHSLQSVHHFQLMLFTQFLFFVAVLVPVLDSMKHSLIVGLIIDPSFTKILQVVLEFWLLLHLAKNCVALPQNLSPRASQKWCVPEFHF